MTETPTLTEALVFLGLALLVLAMVIVEMVNVRRRARRLRRPVPRTLRPHETNTAVWQAPVGAFDAGADDDEADEDQLVALRARFPHLTFTQIRAVLERRLQEGIR